jgi:hypothetical protein
MPLRRTSSPRCTGGAEKLDSCRATSWNWLENHFFDGSHMSGMVPQGLKRFGRLSIVSLPPGEFIPFVREKAQPTGTPLP